MAELEPVELVVVAESFDKLMEHKTVKKQRDKLTNALRQRHQLLPREFNCPK